MQHHAPAFGTDGCVELLRVEQRADRHGRQRLGVPTLEDGRPVHHGHHVGLRGELAQLANSAPINPLLVLEDHVPHHPRAHPHERFAELVAGKLQPFLGHRVSNLIRELRHPLPACLLALNLLVVQRAKFLVGAVKHL